MTMSRVKNCRLVWRKETQHQHLCWFSKIYVGFCCAELNLHLSVRYDLRLTHPTYKTIENW